MVLREMLGGAVIGVAGGFALLGLLKLLEGGAGHFSGAGILPGR